jgi:hypothetical protein
MSDIWFIGNQDMWSEGGWDSPDPVLLGNSTWTWDVEFVTDSTQTTYAKTSVNSVTDIGGDGYMFSGIVQYQTRNSSGTDVPHPVGQTNPSGFFNNGVTDFIWDTAVVDVTFGFGIGGSAGSGLFSAPGVFTANINMEIWVTG